jgi:hypothetical protein
MKRVMDPLQSRSDKVDNARRSLFGLLAAAPLLALGLASRSSAQATACLDLSKLSMADKGLRNSLGYKLQTPDPAKKCGNCAFFTPAGADCGKCMIFNNGPTTPNSFCTSWAKKG